MIEAAGQFRVGAVIVRLFSPTARNWLVFLILTAMLMWPLLLFRVLIFQGAIPASLARGLSYAIELVSKFLLVAPLTGAAIAAFQGEEPSLRAAWPALRASFFPIVGIGIIQAAGVFLGLLLLIVPGIMLAMTWLIAVPVQVVERQGVWESLERSARLTDGHRWKLFGLFLIFLALIIVSILPLSALIFWSVYSKSPVARDSILAGEWAWDCFGVILSSVFYAAIYHELCVIKDGVGTQQIVTAFD